MIQLKKRALRRMIEREGGIVSDEEMIFEFCSLFCLAASLQGGCKPGEDAGCGRRFGRGCRRAVQPAVRSLQWRMISSAGQRGPRAILWRAGMPPMSRAELA